MDLGDPVREFELWPAEEPVPQELPLEEPEAPAEPERKKEPVPA